MQLYKRHYYHNSTKLRRRGLVQRGEYVMLPGPEGKPEMWVVSGFDAETREIHIARDAKLLTVTAEFLSMEWDK